MNSPTVLFRIAAAWLAALLALVLPTSASAQLSYGFRTGNATTLVQSMAYDSNNCPAAGPRAAYVGGVLTNTGGATVTNVSASLSGLGNGFALAGGQPATMAIGSIPAGGSVGIYWLVSYGCSAVSNQPVITVTSSAATLSRTLTLNGRSSISANAGGQVLSATLGPGAVVGQTVYFDTIYDFGGSAVGDEFILQPNGSSSFRADCFRLVGSTITSSNVTPAVVGAQNQFYFTQTVRQSGNGYQIGVRYFFQYLCAATSTVARPFAIQTSGSTNIKYTGNYDGAGSIPITYPGATNPFTITKTASASTVPAGGNQTITYAVTVSNPSAHDSVISSFTDTLPAGATYVGLTAASQVTAANSSSLPSAGATGTLTFSGITGQSYAIAAGGSVSLVYQVTMPSAAGTYTNSAAGNFGQASTATATATVNVVTPTPLSVTKISAAIADPVNSANPRSVPGSTIEYTLLVSNPPGFATTSGTMQILDNFPTTLRLVVSDINGANSGPVRFIDGSPVTGLTYSFASLGNTGDSLEFSNDNGASWTYVPVAGADGTDAAVTNIRIRPGGAMAANTGATFRLRFVVK